MTNSNEALYDVEELTGNPEHPSFNDIITLALYRAEHPRPEEENGHFDRYIRNAIDEHGEEAVKECIRLCFQMTHRSAGSKAFGKEDYVYGIHVGVAAQAYRYELEERPKSTFIAFQIKEE